MKRHYIVLSLVAGCLLHCSTIEGDAKNLSPDIKRIGDIHLPVDYKRVAVPDSSFGAWLRQLPVRMDNSLYLYNGQLKNEQSNHYAIVDKPVGNKDLQQCADVIMRLRTEYMLSIGKGQAVVFNTVQQQYALKDYGQITNNQFLVTPIKLNAFLENVFINCGTASLAKQLKEVVNVHTIKPGDLFIKGGYPGHAVLVADVAIHQQTGKKIFLLLQGFMPAQDIHILKNNENKIISPWYVCKEDMPLVTPNWVFAPAELKQW